MFIINNLHEILNDVIHIKGETALQSASSAQRGRQSSPANWVSAFDNLVASIKEHQRTWMNWYWDNTLSQCPACDPSYIHASPTHQKMDQLLDWSVIKSGGSSSSSSSSSNDDNQTANLFRRNDQSACSLAVGESDSVSKQTTTLLMVEVLCHRHHRNETKSRVSHVLARHLRMHQFLLHVHVTTSCPNKKEHHSHLVLPSNFRTSRSHPRESIWVNVTYYSVAWLFHFLLSKVSRNPSLGIANIGKLWKFLTFH